MNMKVLCISVALLAAAFVGFRTEAYAAGAVTITNFEIQCCGGHLVDNEFTRGECIRYLVEFDYTGPEKKVRVIVKAQEKPGKLWKTRVKNVLVRAPGSYSVVLLDHIPAAETGQTAKVKAIVKVRNQGKDKKTKNIDIVGCFTGQLVDGSGYVWDLTEEGLSTTFPKPITGTVNFGPAGIWSVTGERWGVEIILNAVNPVQDGCEGGDGYADNLTISAFGYSCPEGNFSNADWETNCGPSGKTSMVRICPGEIVSEVTASGDISPASSGH